MQIKADNLSEESKDPLSTYFKTLMEESDRGRFLLLASKIDELLYELLKRFFKEQRNREGNERLFGSMAPLGSFSSRIEMAYRLGLISKTTADCFDILRQIRNDCAHGSEPFSLERGKNADKFEKFKKLSYTVSGMATFLELVERVSAAQAPNSKEPVFLVLTMVHMLLLQSTQSRLQRIGDSHGNLESVNFTPSRLSQILTTPNKIASK